MVCITLQSFYSTDITCQPSTHQPSQTTRTLLLRPVLNTPISSDHPEVEFIDIDTLGLGSNFELGPISSQVMDLDSE
jgi:hypothetical protein